MGSRKDHITGQDRAQIARSCWANGKKRDGTHQRLAQEYQMTRQSVYNIRRKAEEVLPAALEPGRHGPAPWSQMVTVTRHHLVRSVLVLFQHGVSERDLPECLAQMLRSRPALGWISTRLTELAQRAQAQNACWSPAIGEGLAGGETKASTQNEH